MLSLTPFRRSSNALINPFRMFDEFERSFLGNCTEFKTDIQDQGESYLLSADLPGFDKSEIKLELHDDRLTIQAERHSDFEETDKKGNFVRCERSFGAYERSFDLSGIQADAIRAQYENGVLKLTLPKMAPAPTNTRTLEIE